MDFTVFSILNISLTRSLPHVRYQFGVSFTSWLEFQPDPPGLCLGHVWAMYLENKNWWSRTLYHISQVSHHISQVSHHICAHLCITCYYESKPIMWSLQCRSVTNKYNYVNRIPIIFHLHFSFLSVNYKNISFWTIFLGSAFSVLAFNS